MLLLALFALPLAAVDLPRLDGAVKIDGDLSDPLWEKALVIDRFYDTRSAANAEPVVKTVARIGYDSHFLYVSFRNDDPAPANLRAPLVPRDLVGGDQDLVQIDIDAQDDGKASGIFRVNARGVQTDGIYTEATEQDDFAPDFDFETATKITADGWQAEMRIPLSSIRYAQRDPQAWRVTFYRVYPREHRYRFRSTPVVKGQTCWLCTAPRYEGVTGLAPAGSLVVTPYATTRAVSEPSLPSERHYDGGADVKWLAGPSLSVDATIRPDFSQVEADVTELTVNQRFAIFYPEKRPFFMEGSDLLASPIQAIHTRTITSPSWGARVTGRPGDHAFTFIAAGDRAGGSTIIPGPAYSSLAPQPKALAILGRYRYSFGQSSAGLLLTSRSGDGYSNRVFGPDAIWWPSSTDKITTQLLFSHTDDPHVTASQPNGSDHAALVSWNRTSTNLAWNATLEEIGKNFRADSGFLPQTGFRSGLANVVATAYPKKHFTSLQGEVVYEHTEEIDGGRIITEALFPRVSFEGWRGMIGQFAFHPNEKLQARNGTVVNHDYATAYLRFLPSRRVPFLSLNFRTGDEVKVSSALVGRGTSLSAYARLQPAGPLYAEVTANRHRLDIHGALDFDATGLNTRLTWAFSPRAYARIVGDGQRIRYGDGTRDGFFNATVLYAYRLTWQTSLYAGYGDSRVVDAAGDLGKPRRELFIKASYAVRAAMGLH